MPPMRTGTTYVYTKRLPSTHAHGASRCPCACVGETLISALMDRVGNTIPGVVLRCFSWNLFSPLVRGLQSIKTVKKKEGRGAFCVHGLFPCALGAFFRYWRSVLSLVGAGQCDIPSWHCLREIFLPRQLHFMQCVSHCVWVPGWN